MSIFHTEDQGIGFYQASPPPADCFFCSELLIPPFVLWAGSEAIGLHGVCAFKLGAHLIADSREAELAGSEGGKPFYRSRAQAVLRERLR